MKLNIDKITKQFGNKKALDSFSTTLENGVYGLLGPNGAGKTTLINIIVGILKADTGEVKFNEVDIQTLGANYLDRIGYLPQSPTFYKNFKAMEFLLYMCAIKGISKSDSEVRTEKVLKMVNLWDERFKKVGAFSGGMRQRLGIAQALLNDPDVIILDEPTAGLDPKERIRFRNIISKLSSTKVILLATHIVSDIEYIAKEVILIKEGKVIKQAKPTELIKDMREKVWSINVNEGEITNVLERYNISNAVFEDEIYKIRIVSDEKPTKEAVNINPNLEDVYIYYFKEKLVQ